MIALNLDFVGAIGSSNDKSQDNNNDSKKSKHTSKGRGFNVQQNKKGKRQLVDKSNNEQHNSKSEIDEDTYDSEKDDESGQKKKLKRNTSFDSVPSALNRFTKK